MVAIWVSSQSLVKAIENFDLVSIVNCDQETKKVAVVETLRNRKKIGDAQIGRMAKIQLITFLKPKNLYTKAIFLHTGTKRESQSKVIWIRGGKLTFEGEEMEVKDFLRLLNLNLPNQKSEKSNKTENLTADRL